VGWRAHHSLLCPTAATFQENSSSQIPVLMLSVSMCTSTNGTSPKKLLHLVHCITLSERMSQIPAHKARVDLVGEFFHFVLRGITPKIGDQNSTVRFEHPEGLLEDFPWLFLVVVRVGGDYVATCSM
jgi:hypothetical protein